MHRALRTFRLAPMVALALAATAVVVAGPGVAAPAAPASAGPAATALASHRAVYDLRLVRSQGKRALEAVSGRILYDFSGNACDGWVLQFRQVSQLDSGEGRVAVSDLRSSTFEDANAKSFRFTSQNFIDGKPGDPVDGKAERRDGKIAVTLTKPKPTTFDLDGDVVFPTEHMRRVIAAAREGKRLLQLPVYDGSETGQKVYDTLTVIGPPAGPASSPTAKPAEKAPPTGAIGDTSPGKPADESVDEAALAGLVHWPVTVSYFDRGAARGEQTPVYAIGFQLYENGVSRDLTLDYGDFVVAGEMSRLDLKAGRPCR